jgi:CheY-like chemotaxis protein
MKKVILSKDLQRLFPEQGSFLDRTDVKVYPAGSNDEVWRIWEREEADLIVTQLDLPGMKSENLFELIRNDPKRRTTSVIMVCNDTLAHRERCKNCRVNAVLATPVEPAILHIKMQQLLNVAPRMQYRAVLAVAIEGKFRDRPVPFHTENVSVSGMLIRAEEPLKKGAGVYLSFFLPAGTHVSGYGEIVRAERLKGEKEMYQYGVRFTNVDEESKAAIEAVVRLRTKPAKDADEKPKK